MRNSPLQIVLADDDKDDCLIFKEALADLDIPAVVTFAHDGNQLIELLVKNIDRLPDLLFLDLNMPRKNGFDCLIELKGNAKLQSIPVAIFSTALVINKVDWLYDNGARFYICKPAEFIKLKNVLNQVLSQLEPNILVLRQRDNFIITAHSENIEA